MADENIMDPEMVEFAQLQQQQAMVQDAIVKMNNICFDKCVTKPGSSMDSWTEGCLNNCVGRFMDTQKFIVNKLQQKASSMGS